MICVDLESWVRDLWDVHLIGVVKVFAFSFFPFVLLSYPFPEIHLIFRVLSGVDCFGLVACSSSKLTYGFDWDKSEWTGRDLNLPVALLCPGIVVSDS
jgi:hypothetical protein